MGVAGTGHRATYSRFRGESKVTPRPLAVARKVARGGAQPPLKG
jgi:hypothetical protein